MSALPDQPVTRRGDLVERMHGVDVADPYRWLEVGDDPAVRAWVAEQNRITRDVLDVVPSRERWHERLLELMNVPVVQAVQIRGDKLFLLQRESGEQQASLVVRPLSDPATDRILLVDPAVGADD